MFLKLYNSHIVVYVIFDLKKTKRFRVIWLDLEEIKRRWINNQQSWWIICFSGKQANLNKTKRKTKVRKQKWKRLHITHGECNRQNVNIKHWNNNYTSTKSWRGYIFTAVCLRVCLSVCLCVCLMLLVNKIQAERMNRFGRDFR